MEREKPTNTTPCQCGAARTGHAHQCEFCPDYACGTTSRCPDHGPVNGHTARTVTCLNRTAAA